MTEKSIYKIRVDIIDTLKKAELRVLEEIGQSSIYARITNDTHYLSQTAAVIINALQSMILVVFTLVYVAYYLII
jgi:putative ATP-binding cassette transporter